jgi:ABC-2 type transport system ATP-binding protein
MNDVMIEARDLGKKYGDVWALNNVSFAIRRGEVIGFLGPNGAGKTTTMKILTCFIAPTQGTASVNGCDVWNESMGVRTSIGYLPESTPLYTEMLVVEYLRWVAQMRGLKGDAARDRIRKAIDQTALGDVITKEIRALSKGYRQRVGLAQALLHEPPILILDEPMSGLDPNQASEVRDVIKEIGRERTVILSTHNLAEVQVTCDRVLIISKGKLVADDTTEQLQKTAGRQRVVVDVLPKNGGDVGAMRAAVEKIAGVERVEVMKDPGGAAYRAGAEENRLLVIPRGKDDVRADIFRAAVDTGHVLVGLRLEGRDLEDVFRDLTVGNGKGQKTEDRAARAATASDEDDEDEHGDDVDDVTGQGDKGDRSDEES